ncbi:MAG: hypothetical protein LBQ18_06905 [Campylobacteraceae bacterium]|jgi:hypothetical protein|nr:hypothetical protein [Campylobacteraceae bacterium]
MEDKDSVLKEIAALIEADGKGVLELEVMKFMSLEELTSIKESLIKRKNNRKDEQESWYKEWTQKCGK